MALYGAETWTLQNTDWKYLEFSENGAGGQKRSVRPNV